MSKHKFIFFGKIFGFYYELNKNFEKDKDSKIESASTLVQFKKNAKKAYSETKLIFHKVG